MKTNKTKKDLRRRNIEIFKEDEDSEEDEEEITAEKPTISSLQTGRIKIAPPREVIRPISIAPKEATFEEEDEGDEEITYQPEKHSISRETDDRLKETIRKNLDPQVNKKIHAAWDKIIEAKRDILYKAAKPNPKFAQYRFITPTSMKQREEFVKKELYDFLYYTTAFLLQFQPEQRITSVQMLENTCPALTIHLRLQAIGVTDTSASEIAEEMPSMVIETVYEMEDAMYIILANYQQTLITNYGQNENDAEDFASYMEIFKRGSRFKRIINSGYSQFVEQSARKVRAAIGSQPAYFPSWEGAHEKR
ncbi:MAG: hypothetical protein H7831_16210 [Magnetococcus sp. WYHC-3]